MGALVKLPSAATPAESILACFNRDLLAGFIEVAISLFDAADDDPDVEANGDELDGSTAEDEFMSHSVSPWAGPGCAVSDPDLAVDDQPCDARYWDTEDGI